MKFIKTTALLSLFLAFVISACEREDQLKRIDVFSKNGIVLSGAQIAPSNVTSTTSGTGKMDIIYDKRSQTLNYNITWSGLSDSVIAIRVIGPAPAGYASLNPAFTGANPYAVATTPYTVIQDISSIMLRNLTAVAGTKQADTILNKTIFGSSGSYSGSLLIDGVYLKEENLLSGLYYVTIHTGKTYPSPTPATTPVNPAVLPTPLQLQYRWWGELRAQFLFQ